MPTTFPSIEEICAESVVGKSEGSCEKETRDEEPARH